MSKEVNRASIDIDMEDYASPIVSRYNQRREPYDTWGYFCERLIGAGDTYVVTARGYPLTCTEHYTREEKVRELTNEIVEDANAVTHSDDWYVGMEILRDMNGDDLGDIDVEQDGNWRKVLCVQFLICKR